MAVLGKMFLLLLLLPTILIAGGDPEGGGEERVSRLIIRVVLAGIPAQYVWWLKYGWPTRYCNLIGTIL